MNISLYIYIYREGEREKKVYIYRSIHIYIRRVDSGDKYRSFDAPELLILTSQSPLTSALHRTTIFTRYPGQRRTPVAANTGGDHRSFDAPEHLQHLHFGGSEEGSYVRLIDFCITQLQTRERRRRRIQGAHTAASMLPKICSIFTSQSPLCIYICIYIYTYTYKDI